MSTLILKLNATGDVVRTTCLLNRFRSHITWVTAAKNVELLESLSPTIRCLSWKDRTKAADRTYDLVISLEDEIESLQFLEPLRQKQLFGSYLTKGGDVRYTDDSRRWFDLSLISAYGRERADELKYLNRQTYQELLFEGLGFSFDGDGYVLPKPIKTELDGDIAIAPIAGAVWPMKNWAHYEVLKTKLKADGLRVNLLPQRSSLLEHMADVHQHRVLVGGDSLPMHLALGLGTRCVSIFNCTSPWEIYGYGVQTKLVSPLLGEFFYKRGMDLRATSAISLDEVYRATLEQLEESGNGHRGKDAG